MDVPVPVEQLRLSTTTDMINRSWHTAAAPSIYLSSLQEFWND